MNLIRFSFILICATLLSSCIRDSDDCICTQEFRMVTVFIIDEQNNPVEDLLTTVKDEEGKVFDLSDPLLFQGYYSVMTDNYVNDFSTLPKNILFEGRKNSFTVNAEFFINTDECKCHINKVSGPDTLILK